MQDTGNPVLDSLVNIVSNAKGTVPVADMLKIHDALLALAEKEPGGLKRRTKDGYLTDAASAPPDGRCSL